MLAGTNWTDMVSSKPCSQAADVEVVPARSAPIDMLVQTDPTQLVDLF